MSSCGILSRGLARSCTIVIPSQPCSRMSLRNQPGPLCICFGLSLSTTDNRTSEILPIIRKALPSSLGADAMTTAWQYLHMGPDCVEVQMQLQRRSIHCSNPILATSNLLRIRCFSWCHGTVYDRMNVKSASMRLPIVRCDCVSHTLSSHLPSPFTQGGKGSEALGGARSGCHVWIVVTRGSYHHFLSTMFSRLGDI